MKIFHYISAIVFEGSNVLAWLMCMDCILEGHWEDRDNNEDLEEEHNHHCELESPTSFPYDPLLPVYAWNSANHSDDVDTSDESEIVINNNTSAKNLNIIVANQVSSNNTRDVTKEDE